MSTRSQLQPTMQRRHYEYIAYVLSKAPNNATKEDIVQLFVRRLLMTNPQFNSVKFRDACEHNE